MEVLKAHLESEFGMEMTRLVSITARPGIVKLTQQRFARRP